MNRVFTKSKAPLWLVSLFIGLSIFTTAGEKTAPAIKHTADPQTPFEGLSYRSIGPFRGGRSAAVTGVSDDPTTFYQGATGGGVWRTNDGGSNWKNISDGYFGGSIGAIAVSQWDPNVIYVGGGEVTVRGNVSHGKGIWKSLDRGKTWRHMGLADSRHIPRIRIHPKNPDLVYAAALGHLYGPNPQRGVFRSSDGGETWQKILEHSDEVGAVDLAMDPGNPRILFASLWRVKRTPYSLESGGEGSGLWKSTDGGDSWQEISTNKGFAKGILGIIGVSVSPVNPQRIWAMVEAEKGGVFRSDDGGTTWTLTNGERNLRQRAWYYTRIYADTKDEDKVYVLNVAFWKSKDGGRSFESIRTPHGDHHDLWISPSHADTLAVADDGGTQISFDGGDSWSTYHNQPTAQFYRVTTDHHFPYRIYGAQQDNSSVRILHRSSGDRIRERDWEPTAGGESGHLAPHPENPDIVYGGSYGGYLTRYDHQTRELRLIDVWPDNPMGHGAGDLRYRFQWNFPIFFSPHDANTLYTAANHLFKTTDQGQSWQRISPDLTRNDPGRSGPSGGPITKDNTSVEYYATIFAAAESHHEPGVLWSGSDDGLLFLSKDGGEHWLNRTPKKLPEWMQINSLEIDPHHKGGLYFAGTRYKSDDFQPYLYKTEDYGKSWRKITAGIPDDQFTRVIRADPHRQGLLFAGTEEGIYVSLDDGKHWQSLQLNLPIVPITDLAVKQGDLIAATQGRSFWVMDDLSPLHQWKPSLEHEKLHLFEPRPAYRLPGRAAESPGNNGQNLAAGVLIHFYLAEKPPAFEEKPKDPSKPDSSQDATDPKAIRILIKTPDGQVIREFSTHAEKKADRFEAKKGFNRFIWDMRYQEAEDFPDMILWSGNLNGPLAVPGRYKVVVTQAELSRETTCVIKPDPRSKTRPDDLQAQFDFLMEIREKLSQTHRAVKRIRTIRTQLGRITKPLQGDETHRDLLAAAEAIKKKITTVEETLYQTKNKSRQDPLNFPIRLNDKVAGLNRTVAIGHYRPTDQAIEVKNMLFAAISDQLKALDLVIENDLPAFNDLVAGKSFPAISLEEK